MPSLIVPLLLIVCCATPGAVLALDNQLTDHPSPYLALHGGDPVPWQEWGEVATEAARRDDRILFVSSGYFSCHWCHVMQQESYADPAVAALLATHFVPVKIDRELEPALDAHLIDFTERTQGRAGWPLNVFLTPEGYPLVGFTYLPRDRFIKVLERVVEIWTSERAETRDAARRALLELTARQDPQPEPALAAAELRRLLARDALAFGDDMSGGFGRQSKFPMAPQLLSLLALQQAHPNAELAELLRLTLDEMAANGLRDHLAGGFFRYAVDPGWQVPHYEKMLYTQALLSLAYLRGADVLDEPGYLDIARETLDFVLADMAVADGGYAASLSAVDDAGVEGGGYLWGDAELESLLSADALELARRHWNLHGVPPTDGGYLPTAGESAETLAVALGRPPEQVAEQLRALEAQLLSARAKRRIPVDDKVLAAWNGLLLAAFAEAAGRLQEPRYAEAGTRLAAHLRERMAPDGELVRALARGRPLGRAGLEDHAFTAWGLLAWGEAQGDQRAYTAGTRLLLAGWERFFDQGWHATDRPPLPGMLATAAETGGPLPAPSATLMRLSLRSGHPGLVAKVGEALELARPQVQQQPFWHSELALLLQR